MASGEHAGFPPGPSTDPSWPAQMTRRLGESLFLLNNARITPEAHAAEVAEVLDRIVNSESRGAVSKLLALDTLRDAGLIGDAQLAVQKNTVLAQRTAIDDANGGAVRPDLVRQDHDLGCFFGGVVDVGRRFQVTPDGRESYLLRRRQGLISDYQNLMIEEGLAQTLLSIFGDRIRQVNPCDLCTNDF